MGNAQRSSDRVERWQASLESLVDCTESSRLNCSGATSNSEQVRVPRNPGNVKT